MRPQVGKASIYADKFANRKMANGKPMNPKGDNAASKTLPLGTRALVTNLQTGKSAVVTIEDRGPYVDGRIVDLSPATAEKIGLERRQGLAPVEVRPLELPPSARVASAGASGDDGR
jgi:rare lipoprotein A